LRLLWEGEKVTLEVVGARGGSGGLTAWGLPTEDKSNVSGELHTGDSGATASLLMGVYVFLGVVAAAAVVRLLCGVPADVAEDDPGVVS
jgi:hypothetical protein